MRTDPDGCTGTPDRLRRTGARVVSRLLVSTWVVRTFPAEAEVEDTEKHAKENAKENEHDTCCSVRGQGHGQLEMEDTIKRLEDAPIVSPTGTTTLSSILAARYAVSDDVEVWGARMH